MWQAWAALIVAGVLEVVWASTLKETRGFTRLWPSVVTLAVMGVSFYLLAWSVKSIPVSIAYPIWVGIGAAGTWLVAVTILGEPWRPWQLLWVALIVLSVIALKIGTPAPAAISPLP